MFKRFQPDLERVETNMSLDALSNTPILTLAYVDSFKCIFFVFKLTNYGKSLAIVFG